MRSQAKHRMEHSSWVAAAVLAGIVAALYFMREIMIPFAFALTLAFLLTPVVTFLQRLRFGRVTAVILTLILSIGAAGWAGWAIGNQLLNVVNRLPIYRETIHEKVQALSLPEKGSLGRAAQSVKQIGQEISSAAPAAPNPDSPVTQRPVSVPMPPPVPVQVVQPTGLTDLRNWSDSFVRPVVKTGIVIIFAIFMLIKREDLRNRLLRLTGLTQLNVMTEALDDAAKRVSRYLLMQFLVNAAVGAVVGCGLYFIGLPNPALWGVIAAILRVVPYVGMLVASALPILVSMAIFSSWVPPLLVLLLFAIVELLVSNFAEPLLYGAHTGISSLALLVTTVFWAVLWGPAGLVLSTPLTVCVVVMGRYIPQFSFLHVILGDEPVLAAEAQLYQRLLAMDQQEARNVVDLFLESRPLIELYDAVLIPALNMAEQDRHRGAIDAMREEFLFLSVNEMVAEFAAYKPVQNPPVSEENAEVPVRRQSSNRRIFCIPAHDQADEIAAAMLAQILEQEGWAAEAFSIGSSRREGGALPEVGSQDILCISALPPYAFAPAQLLWKDFRARYPKTTVLVCIWGFAGDPPRAVARFEGAQPEQLITSISQGLEAIKRFDPSTSAEPKIAVLA